MWEVVAKSRLSGIERKRVTDRWERATELAFKALEHGWRVKIKKYYTDILIPDCDSGDYVCVASKVDPREASRFSSDFPQFKHFPYSLSSISQSYQKISKNLTSCCDETCVIFALLYRRRIDVFAMLCS